MNNTVTNVVFLGGKEIGAACFAILLDFRLKLGFEIVAVLSNDRSLGTGGRSVRELAADAGIPVLRDLDAYLAIPDVDLAISVQYHEILKPAHISKARGITVNYHMAPLPEYRGCNQFTLALLNNDTEFGTTLHRLETSIDGGAIIAERRFPIPPNCWVKDLYDLTFRETTSLFQETVPSLKSGKYTLTPQKAYEGVRAKSLHYRKEINSLKKIDFDWPPEKILRHVRATSMPGFSPPYFDVPGYRIYLSAEPRQEN